jgi:hypothetical protein
MASEWDVFPEQKEPQQGLPVPDPFSDAGFLERDDQVQFSGTGEVLTNIPSSAYKYAEDLLTPILSPIDTASALYEAGPSGIAKAVVQHYVERYGDLDKAMETIKRDPVGAVADVSGIGGLVRNIPTKATRAVGNVAQIADPFRLPGNALKQGGQWLARTQTPQEMYSQAMKPRPSLPADRRARIVETALDEQVMPTKRGVKTVQQRIQDLDNELERYISEATLRGHQINASDVLMYLDDLRSTKGGFRKDALKDLDVIDQARADFLEMVEATGRTWVTPAELQAFKRDLYKGINYDKARGTKTRVEEDIDKNLARAAKDLVAKEIPDAHEINQRMGRLIELESELERASNRIGNRNVIGAGPAWTTTAGASIDSALNSGGLFTAIGAGAGILEKPLVKARLALVIKKMQEKDVGWLNRNSHWPEYRYLMYGAGGLTNQEEEQQ